MQRKKLRILVADDHPVVRRGLCLLIEREEDMMVCAEAEDTKEVLRAAVEHKPDLALLDISLKNSNGLELLKDMRRRVPEIPVLMLSVHDENVYAERAVQAGARGYVMKQEATERVLDAIRRVARGELYLSENVQSRLLRISGGLKNEETTPVTRLSNRELEVFEMVGRGKGRQEIAKALGISIRTAEAHFARIKEKLGLKSQTELLQQATLWLLGENGG